MFGLSMEAQSRRPPVLSALLLQYAVHQALPYDYDAVMGITKVGTKEAEGFDEDLDTAEYHDAAEEPTRRDESDNTVEPQRLSDFQGGYGSSSLKECIELLNTTSKIAPAPLDSGVGQKSTEPSHFRTAF